MPAFSSAAFIPVSGLASWFFPGIQPVMPPTLALEKNPPVKDTMVSLNEFVDTVVDGQSNVVVGLYVPGVLALPVGQQPQGNSGYVTREPEQATQFDLAGDYGTIGILAHNDLAGAQFSGVIPGQYAIAIFGDGRMEYFLIDTIQSYQALSPTSTYSDFVNLDGSNEHLTAGQLFNRIYAPGNRMVLQTCIEGEGNPSWGRMFIIGTPATSQVLSVVKQTSFVLEFASFGLATR